jgi:hypothetical protein
VKICVIEGCDRPARALGWCRSHRWRFLQHGDPLAGRVTPGLPAESIARAILYQGDDCLAWPYASKQGGYGKLKRRLVTHIVCEAVYGPKPSAKHEVAHACRNPPCINPRHLRWDTRKGNLTDKRLHGTHARGEQVNGARLTPKDVIAIRSQPNRSHADLAREYSVSLSNIWAIRNRRNWKHIP